MESLSLTWYRMPSTELSTTWIIPALPANSVGALMSGRQKSPIPVVFTMGTMSVQLYGASVSVVARNIYR